MAFRIGIAAGAILFVAGLGYEAYLIAHREGPARSLARPGLDRLDGYRLAMEHLVQLLGKA